jgi:hypothetical protein
MRVVFHGNTAVGFSGGFVELLGEPDIGEAVPRRTNA